MPSVLQRVRKNIHGVTSIGGNEGWDFSFCFWGHIVFLSSFLFAYCMLIWAVQEWSACAIRLFSCQQRHRRIVTCDAADTAATPGSRTGEIDVRIVGFRTPERLVRSPASSSRKGKSRSRWKMFPRGREISFSRSRGDFTSIASEPSRQGARTDSMGSSRY